MSDTDYSYSVNIKCTGKETAEELCSKLVKVSDAIEQVEMEWLSGLRAADQYKAEVQKLLATQDALTASLLKSASTEDAAAAQSASARREHARAVQADERATRSLGDALEGLAATEATAYRARGQLVAVTDASAAAMGRAGAAMGRAGAGSRNLGMAVLEGSRALEDMQYGLHGVINNVPSLVTALGGSAGVAGAISVITVGAFQLYKHWDDLMGLMGVGIPQPTLEGPELLASELKKATKEMDDLREKTNLTLGELKRIGELKVKIEGVKQQQEEQKATDAVLNVKGAKEEKNAAAFRKAIGEAGGGKAAAEELAGSLEKIADEQGQVYSMALDKFDSPRKIAEGLLREGAAGNKQAEREVVSLSEKANGRATTLTRALDFKGRGDEAKGIIAEARKAGLTDVADGLDAGLAGNEHVDKSDLDRMRERVRVAKQAADNSAKAKAKTEHDKFIGDYAKSFAHSEGGTRPLTPDFTPESVFRDLKEGGMDEDKARANAAEIHKEAVRLADEKVAQHALDMGPGVTRKDAAVDLFKTYEESKDRKDARRAGETPAQHKERVAAEARQGQIAGAYDQDVDDEIGGMMEANRRRREAFDRMTPRQRVDEVERARRERARRERAYRADDEQAKRMAKGMNPMARAEFERQREAMAGRREMLDMPDAPLSDDAMAKEMSKRVAKRLAGRPDGKGGTISGADADGSANIIVNRQREKTSASMLGLGLGDGHGGHSGGLAGMSFGPMDLGFTGDLSFGPAVGQVDPITGDYWDEKGRLRHKGIAGGGVRGGDYTRPSRKPGAKAAGGFRNLAPLPPGSMAREALAAPATPDGPGSTEKEGTDALVKLTAEVKDLKDVMEKVRDGIPFTL